MIETPDSHRSSCRNSVGFWGLPKTFQPLITPEWMDSQNVLTNGSNNTFNFGLIINKITGITIYLWQNSLTIPGATKQQARPRSKH